MICDIKNEAKKPRQIDRQQILDPQSNTPCQPKQESIKSQTQDCIRITSQHPPSIEKTCNIPGSEQHTLKKKIQGTHLGQRGQNWSRNQVFCHFLKFGSLIFLEIAYNDSLQQCLECSRSKIYEKNFWGPNLPKIDPETRFLPFSQV